LWAALLLVSMLSSAVIAVAPQPLLSLLFASDALILLSGCMVCHGELYRRRPEPSRLTSYYLAIAVGGALGGAFVSLAAPLLFATYAEYIIALHAAAVLLIVCVLLDPTSALRRRSRARAAWFVFFALWIVVISANINAWVGRHKLSVENLRNFYGAMSLLLVGSEHPESMYMRLVHGRITHGIQIANPEYRMWPTTYYGVDSGLGRLLNQRPEYPRRVGIVGLGVGTLATYGLPGGVYRFYEINPQVIRAADNGFTYLSDARERGTTIDIIPGDARLSMEREEPQQYDVIVLDAFTGDAIPMHLLTREAFELYKRHLKPGGVIAVHTSNRYLRLGRPIRAVAKSLGMDMRVAVSEGNPERLVSTSKWALVTDDPALFDDPALRDLLMPVNPDEPPMQPWTDEFASVMSVLEWGGVPVTLPPAPATAPQESK
jgi:SAM-dependent methyltransferase